MQSAQRNTIAGNPASVQQQFEAPTKRDTMNGGGGVLTGSSDRRGAGRSARR